MVTDAGRDRGGSGIEFHGGTRQEARRVLEVSETGDVMGWDGQLEGLRAGRVRRVSCA